MMVRDDKWQGTVEDYENAKQLVHGKEVLPPADLPLNTEVDALEGLR